MSFEDRDGYVNDCGPQAWIDGARYIHLRVGPSGQTLVDRDGTERQLAAGGIYNATGKADGTWDVERVGSTGVVGSPTSEEHNPSPRMYLGPPGVDGRGRFSPGREITPEMMEGFRTRAAQLRANWSVFRVAAGARLPKLQVDERTELRTPRGDSVVVEPGLYRIEAFEDRLEATRLATVDEQLAAHRKLLLIMAAGLRTHLGSPEFYDAVGKLKGMVVE